MELKDLQTRGNPDWCPGCGNYGILAAVKQAIVELNLPPGKIVIATGIGCGSKINQWIRTYAFEGLHGRSIPVSMGIKMANPELTVLDIAGDGDGYGIGMGHFINTMRRNLDVTYIIQNNQVYGLTMGQVSPTAEKGAKSPSTPDGVIEEPINPIRLALSSDCTFVARGFAGDIPHLTYLIVEAIKHKGFSFIDVLQPCVTFNPVNTHQFYKERCYKLEDVKGYDKTNLLRAYEVAGEWGEKIPIGIFYQIQKPTYEESDFGLKSGPPVKADISNIDIGPLMENFM